MKNDKSNATAKTPNSDYDSAWKDVIEVLFEPFLEFFFPQIHRDVDFTKEYDFLSKELIKIIPHNKVGKRYADELVKVHLKDGTTKCIAIYIHIEVQGQKEDGFAERMYVYNYRIYDKNREDTSEVISLAVLTDGDPNYRPNEYLVERWGYMLKMTIPIVKIVDYKLDPEKKELLEKSSNPMAMVVEAHLESEAAKKEDDDYKYNTKYNLIRKCYEKGYNKDQVLTLMKFVDWIIHLPKSRQKLLNEKLIKYEKEHNMAYITTWERDAEEKGLKEGEAKGIAKGIAKGEAKGIAKGIAKGEAESKRHIAKNLIMRGIALDLVAEATGLTREELDKLVIHH